MNSSNLKFYSIIILSILMSYYATSMAGPLGTSFIYQGSLTDVNLPATGYYDLQFKLFDGSDPNDSNQVGTTNNFFDFLVDNNSFTVELDFIDVNSSVLEVWGDGQSRWLEIGARYISLPTGLKSLQSYTILAPRQKIMPVPFALYAISAGSDSKWTVSDSNMYSNVSGNIGIGTASPHYKFDVFGTISGHTTANPGLIGQSLSDTGVTGLSVHAPGVYGYSSADTGVYGYSDSNEGVGVYGYNGSNVGIFGDSYGGYGVYGYSDYYVGMCGYCPSYVGVVGYGGVYDFYAGGPGINYGYSSSKRWKTDITPIDDPLDKVMNLRGVYYNWDKEHGGKHDIGMIAEEVGKILPEIVAYEPDGQNASGMDYGKLTPLLIEAVKALKAENDTLKRRIEALEKK
jgi:hypothetical protein